MERLSNFKAFHQILQSQFHPASSRKLISMCRCLWLQSPSLRIRGPGSNRNPQCLMHALFACYIYCSVQLVHWNQQHLTKMPSYAIWISGFHMHWQAIWDWINSGQEFQMEVSVAGLLNLHGDNWINDQACWSFSNCHENHSHFTSLSINVFSTQMWTPFGTGTSLRCCWMCSSEKIHRAKYINILVESHLTERTDLQWSFNTQKSFRNLRM